MGNEMKTPTPRPARHPIYYYLYRYGVLSVGLGLIPLSLWQIWRDALGHQWIILAALTVLTSSFNIKIPGVNSKISIGDTFFFTNVILYGPGPGVITAALEALTGSLHARSASRRAEYALFNIASFSLSAYAGATVFFLLLGRGPLHLGDVPRFADFIFPIGMLALVHYLVNSGSVATIIALEAHKNIYQIWKDCFLWTCITYFAGAATGGLIAANARSIRPEIIGVIAPVMLAVYYTYRTYLDKVLELNRLYISTVESLAMAIDAKDQVTHGHVRRVQVFVRGLGRAMGLQDEEALRWIEAAALLHDIGKLAVPEYILNKPGKLTQTEFKKVMIHPAVGSDILASVKFPYDVAQVVRHHHEHWDGTGYPDGLSGEKISLGARILAVVDAFDAMTSDRPYRAAMTKEEALRHIQSEAGTRYDPAVVQCFETVIDSLMTQAQAIEHPEPAIVGPAAAVENGPGAGVAPAEGVRVTAGFQNIVETHREVSALFDLAQTLGSTLHVEEALSLIASKIARLLPFDACVIYLHSAEKGTLSAAHVCGGSAHAFKGYTMEFGKNLSGWVAAHNHPAVNADPVFDLLPLRPLLDAELENSLVYPLNANGICLGTISLYCRRDRKFDDDHVRVMETVAQRAAQAIHNAITYEETQVDALTDRLTALPNGRYLDIYFEREVEKARRFKYPLSVLAMDLDGFKLINDTHGHSVGDLMLLEVAKALNRTIRASDVVARQGGDEFVAVISQTGVEEVNALAKRIQREIEGIRLPVERGDSASVGISVGVAAFPEDGCALSILLKKADQAMYLNKQGRRPAPPAPRRPLELVPLRRA